MERKTGCFEVLGFPPYRDVYPVRDYYIAVLLGFGGVNMSDFSTQRRSFPEKKSITVVGAGVSGRSLALLAKKSGYSVFVTEQKEIDLETRKIFEESGITFESGKHSSKMLECDAMVLSSGISPVSKPVVAARKKKILLLGELDFVRPFLLGSIIGITGSNGKTTTTMLTGHLFEKCGFKASVAGNVGSPLAEHAGVDNDIIVAELSSFQLFWAENFDLDLAVVTNIDPDNIDWHGTLEEYFRSKRKILKMLMPEGKVICQFRDIPNLLLEEDWTKRAVPLYWGRQNGCEYHDSIVMLEDTAVLSGSDGEIRLFDYKDVPLLGKHNLENAAMSFASMFLKGGDLKKAGCALHSFKAPSHRCEPVACIKGVYYVDDSKGTNVAATITALSSLKGRKIVILGGKGKGEDYRPLAVAVSREAEGAVVIGEERTKICDALKNEGFSAYSTADTMKEAVQKASRMSRKGYVVLLSPACTSWDMYANYKERGDDFKRSVESLTKRDI